METNLRTLGPNEAKAVLTFREQGRSVVHAADVIALLGNESTARKVIRNLLRKGWLTRLLAGRYLFLPPEHGPENLGENNALAIASAVVEPSYVGWWAAAAYHGLTTQKPVTISVATQRPLSPRMIEGSEIHFVKVVERKFFGFKSYDLYGREAVISTPAKTVVDCLDRPDLTGGVAELARIVYGAAVDANPEEVIDTAFRMKSTALVQRLGFLSELIGRKWPAALRARLRAAIAPSMRAVLGRSERKAGDIGYVAAWGLLVNISESDLLADVPRVKRRGQN
jgi:predicted transcriptional regulator of viral defense system